MSNLEWNSGSASQCYMSHRIPDPNNPLGITEGDELLDGRYRIHGPLGRGGFAAVLHAHDNLRLHDVALKVAHAPNGDAEVAREALRHELDMYTAIGSHPHVLRAYDLHCASWRGADLLFLSMECADGSLRDWLIENKDDYAARRAQGPSLFAQICQVISPIHRANIVHLDVKPENLLFVRGVLKIADFGASRHGYGLEKQKVSLTDFRHALVLTPPYAAPELLSAGSVRLIHPQADVFSIGVIMFEILSRDCCAPSCTGYEELHDRCMELMPRPPVGPLANAVRVMARCLEETQWLR